MPGHPQLGAAAAQLVAAARAMARLAGAGPTWPSCSRRPRAVTTRPTYTAKMVSVVDRQRPAGGIAAGGLLPHPADWQRGVQHGQPVHACCLPVCSDLGHVLP